MLYDRSKMRILKVDTPKSLPPLHIYYRVGPKFSAEPSFTAPSENNELWIGAMQEDYVWLLARNVGSHGQQRVPALGGFIYVAGKVPAKKSSID